jgi:hypothetical protein
MAGAPAVDGDGTKERRKACESGPPNADIVWKVQSSVMPVMIPGRLGLGLIWKNLTLFVNNLGSGRS